MPTLTRFALAIIGPFLVATIAQAQDVQVDGTTVRVTLTPDALQARNPVPPTVTTVTVAGAPRDIWCVSGQNPAPDFKALLTARVAGQPARMLNALKSSVNSTPDRHTNLESLFHSGPNNHYLYLLQSVGPPFKSQTLTGAQRNALLTGQPISIPIDFFVGSSRCYTTAQIDSVIAEALRIIDVVIAELGQ